MVYKDYVFVQNFIQKMVFSLIRYFLVLEIFVLSILNLQQLQWIVLSNILTLCSLCLLILHLWSCMYNYKITLIQILLPLLLFFCMIDYLLWIVIFPLHSSNIFNKFFDRRITSYIFIIIEYCGYTI